MTRGAFLEALANERALLAEGAVVERLKRDPSTGVNENSLTAALLYEATGRGALAEIYRQYLEIGRRSGLPMVLLTPTWRAVAERIEKAGLAGRDVNGDAVRFLRSLSEDHEFGVYIGGLIGCRGDAYRPGQALMADDAADFHQTQLNALTAAGADFLIAETLPAASEARGIAKAMAKTGLPSVLSFVIQSDGCLLDGTRMGALIDELDSGPLAPSYYFFNCTHHSVIRAAMGSMPRRLHGRVLGCQANTSARTPDELDGLEFLDTEAPDQFAEGLAGLHRDYGFKILGGCCGSDDRHIRALAAKLGEAATV